MAAGDLEVEDATVGRRLDNVHEVDAAGARMPSEELQQLRRVVVASEHDDRRELGKLPQRVAGQLKIVDRGPRTVEEVARMDNQVGLNSRATSTVCSSNIGQVFSPRRVAVRAAEMPVGDVQQPHSRSPRLEQADALRQRARASPAGSAHPGLGNVRREWREREAQIGIGAGMIGWSTTMVPAGSALHAHAARACRNLYSPASPASRRPATLRRRVAHDRRLDVQRRLLRADQQDAE